MRIITLRDRQTDTAFYSIGYYFYRIWLKQAGLEARTVSHVPNVDKVALKQEIDKASSRDCDPRLPFTKEYRSKVLDHSKMHGLKAASEKFDVSLEDLKLWTRRAGKKFTRDIPDESKRNIVEWGVKINSWKMAARKYDVHPSTVGLWARKFNLKLRPGGNETYQEHTTVKLEEKVKADDSTRKDIETTSTGRNEFLSMPRLNQKTIIRDENSKHFEYYGKYPRRVDNDYISFAKKTPPKKIKKEVWKVRQQQQRPFIWQPVIDEISEETIEETFDASSSKTVGVSSLLDKSIRDPSVMKDAHGNGGGFCEFCQQQLDDGESLYEHFAIHHIV